MEEIVERLSKGAWYTFISILIIKLFAVINSMVIARLLGPTKFGIYSILFSLQGILLVFASFGYPTVITKFIAEYNVKTPSKVNRIYFTSFLNLFTLAIIISLFFFFSADFIALKIYNEKALKPLIQLMCGVVFVMTLISLNNSVLQGLQKIKLLSKLNILNSILNVLAMYLLISNFGLIGAPMAGLIVGVFFFLITINIVLKLLNLNFFDFKLAWDKEFVRKIFRLSFPLVLSNLAVLFALWAAKTYLARTTGMKEVGFYQIAESLNYIIGYIPFAVSIPFLPLVSELEALSTSKLTLITSRVLKYSTLIILPVALTIGVMAKFLISLLFGKPYLEAWEITYVLSIGTFLMSFGILIGAVLNGTGRMWQGLGLNLVWMVLFLGICYFLIPTKGLIGMGYSYILSYILYTCILFFYSVKNLGIRFSDLKAMTVISVTFFFIGWLLVNAYNGFNLILFGIFLMMLLLCAEFFILSPEERTSLLNLIKRTIKI